MEGQADKPTSTQVEYFIKIVKNHDKIEEMVANDEQIYRIRRIGDMRDITVYLTNLYTIGSADIIDITFAHRDVNCIVTMSNWNQYTGDAKAYASENKIGLFKMSEFMGALNWTFFWKYKKKSA